MLFIRLFICDVFLMWQFCSVRYKPVFMCAVWPKVIQWHSIAEWSSVLETTTTIAGSTTVQPTIKVLGGSPRAIIAIWTVYTRRVLQSTGTVLFGTIGRLSITRWNLQRWRSDHTTSIESHDITCSSVITWWHWHVMVVMTLWSSHNKMRITEACEETVLSSLMLTSYTIPALLHVRRMRSVC